MADPAYFNVGMIVCCETLHSQKLQGEVMAFDYPSKMLILKSAPKGSKSNAHTVHVVNLLNVRDIEVISEAPDQSTKPIPPLPNLNFSKLRSRCRSSVDEKMRKLGYIGVGVSPVGQSLVEAIIKTIPEVRWIDKNIVVLDKVTIVPPYTVDCCTADESSSQALQHVQKLVGKFHKDNSEPLSSSSSSTLLSSPP